MLCVRPLLFFMAATPISLSLAVVTTIPKDYSLARGTLFAGAMSSNIPIIGPFIAAPTIALGTFLTFQTGKVKFVFDDEAMEIFLVRNGENKSRENFVVGGKNRWKFDTFTEWGFLPSKGVPILMYFKETQTKPEGQFHLFPVIMNGKNLYDTLVEKVGL